MHELLTPQWMMLTPLDELVRRLHEITAQHLRFREEAPLVLSGEARHRFSGGLVVARPHAEVA